MHPTHRRHPEGGSGTDVSQGRRRLVAVPPDGCAGNGALGARRPPREPRVRSNRLVTRANEPATGPGIRSASACRCTSSPFWCGCSSPTTTLCRTVFFGWATLTDARAWKSLLKGFWINVQVFMIAEVIVLVWALVVAVMRLLPGPACKPIRLLATVYVDVFRGIPALLVILIVGLGLPQAHVPIIGDFSDMQLRDPGAQPDLRRLRVGGVPRRHRVGALEPDRSSPVVGLVVCADDASRRGAAGRAPGDPAAAQRLHRAAEGHSADRCSRRSRRGQPGPVRQQLARGTLAAYSMAAMLFLAVTIPFTRWLDGLIRRQQAKTLAGR